MESSTSGALTPGPPATELDSGALRLMGAIADTGSITAAAQRLGLSQPAASQQLKRLERRLGMPAVERVGRGVRLTEAGLILARHAKTVDRALHAAVDEVAALAGLRSGRVRLAAFPSASSTLVPELLARLAAEYPGIGVTYLEAEPPEAVAAVRAGEADVAITFSYPGDPEDPHRESAVGLSVHELGPDPMRVILPAGHRVAGAGSVPLHELRDEQWIAGCPRCRGHLLGLCRGSGFEPTITHETDNVIAVTALVGAGLGVALLPSLALAAAPLPDGVVARPTDNADDRALHLVSTSHAQHVPAVAALLRIAAHLPSTARMTDDV
ncbi:LysR family transcriptional regulator [Plantibacter flavus]|uniref:LysR family transcriptional regulator n=1 Tax=Plantibacter flavus TaxID=150123 RepID=UPI003F17DEA3